jgi:hypothetical protein
MPPTEWKWVTPEEMIQNIETTLKRMKEDKYALQTGLKDLDFDMDMEELTRRGFSVPFPSIAQAEQALLFRLIRPKQIWEYDGTVHQVMAFHPQQIGYSGFMDFVTHSLALTNLGLFEVGRYPAVSLERPGKYWQWFLHRRLAVPEQVIEWQEKEGITGEQLLNSIYQAITGL